MFKKRSYSPVLQKMANLLAEMRRPIAARLKISLKYSRKLKRVKLLRHYNYGYIQEYEYSPSCTPSVRRYYYKREEAKKLRFGCRGLFDSMFLVSGCLGEPSGEAEDENRPVFSRNLSVGSEALGCNEEREMRSIDERAEEFIERFYEEMRRQQYVMKQFDAMVNV